MSEPITRAEMAAIIEAVRNTGFPLLGYQGGPIPPSPFVAMADAMAAALSASPPRVPGASAHPLKVGVESGPGQPIDICEWLSINAAVAGAAGKSIDLRRLREAAAEIRRLREDNERLRLAIAEEELSYQEAWEGRYRAGIEAAAKYHDDQAAEWSEHYTKNGNDPSAREYAKQHSADAAAIRALADKPAPDAQLAGLMEARKMMTKYAAREPIMDAWDALRDKIDLEIAARKGG